MFQPRVNFGHGRQPVGANQISAQLAADLQINKDAAELQAILKNKKSYYHFLTGRHVSTVAGSACS
jgi:hypothetical protein